MNLITKIRNLFKKKQGMEIDGFGNKEWKLNGVLHREDGPAEEWANGSKFWYLHGERHREDGPAIENAHGYKFWYLHGERHREDGPAVELYSFEKNEIVAKRWYLHGIELSEEEFNHEMKIRKLTKLKETVEKELNKSKQNNTTSRKLKI